MCYHGNAVMLHTRKQVNSIETFHCLLEAHRNIFATCKECDGLFLLLPHLRVASRLTGQTGTCYCKKSGQLDNILPPPQPNCLPLSPHRQATMHTSVPKNMLPSALSRLRLPKHWSAELLGHQHNRNYSDHFRSCDNLPGW